MAGEKIRILIVDDHEATVQTITTRLKIYPDFDVVGTAGDGIAAIEQVKLHRPDVVLMDINMPRMDGIAATEVILTTVPETAVVMVSAQSDSDFLRRSMNVGASFFLPKPISSDELDNAIRRAHEISRLRRARLVRSAPPQPASGASGTIIAVFSPSGGVGRTTIAANLAIGIRRTTAKRVALVDLSLPFGDVGILLNAPRKSRTIADLIGKFAELDGAALDGVLFENSSGVRALLAPPTPESEELISAADVRRVLGLLRERYSYIVVDTWPSYGETILAVLQSADTILLPLTLELTGAKNARVFIDVATKLGIDSKVKLVVNRGDEVSGLKLADLEAGLGRKVAYTLSSDEQALRVAMNRGVSVLDSHGDRRIAKDFLAMARGLGGVGDPAAASR